MTTSDTWFLLVRYPDAGKTEVRRFDDSKVAAQAYSDAEAEQQHSTGRADVLLVGAPSLDVVKERYPSYFIDATSAQSKLAYLLSIMPPLPA
ncbi:hypothetical protein [Saccharopolyspora flava]|uniref:Uncharacterized protein n=1 Tax=Saccharopolyspora flava TaxID=95161 RepID=A0A1I6NRL3_9PSEU|nr:hypothetical protein [Saccharopolyspora flava]SFS30495.1 hypothetical protein SAMN05660874_00006 [Saccharopolyspora flava]